MLAAIFSVFATGQLASAQSLAVLPVNVLLAPGQSATTLSVTNQANSETAIQIRAYAWNQANGEDELIASDAVLASPPLASIAPGATQVVRLVLRKLPQGGEGTYRILVDQIPPPAEAGVVHVVLRLSIPIFAQPLTRAVPHVQFHVENDSGHLFLVGVNDGLHHEAIREIVLSTSDGRKLNAEPGASPYILAGATRRWPIHTQDSMPPLGETLRLTAHSDAGAIEQQVNFVPRP
jgi:fimbrial chaperone protein